MPNNPESWQDKHIYLWMTEESKQVLIEKNIAAAPTLKKTRVLISVEEKYSDTTCQHR
jgi:hypothetical protein